MVACEDDLLPSEREMQLALSRALAEQAGRLLGSIQDACQRRLAPRPHIVAR